jgi:uncharacterized protein YciI
MRTVSTLRPRFLGGGRTSEALDRTFGLVVFEADSEAATQAFVQADPAVKAGVMTATLQPYVVALQRKQ